jgi:hypothetical protein
MPKFEFQISRRSISLETYFVEADSEEEALEICNDGNIPEPMLEFLDWIDDEYQVDGKECIDPLYTMIKEHTPKETT